MPLSDMFIVCIYNDISYLKVISVDMEMDRVHVRVKPHMDIDFSAIYGDWSLTDHYYSSQEVCHKLHLSNLLLSRISSSCSCEQGGNGRYTYLSCISEIYRMAGNIGVELYLAVGEKKPVAPKLIHQYNFIV